MPYQSLEPAGDLLEQPVAGGVAEGVVDGLEVIQIDEQQGADQIVAARLAKGVGQGFVQLAAVGQAGQLVVIGEILDAALGLLALGDILETDDEVADLPPVILHRGDYFPLRIGIAIRVQALGLPLPTAQGAELVAKSPQPAPEIVAQMQADHPLAVKAGDLAESVVDPQNLEIGVGDDDPFMGFKRYGREAQLGIALQPLQLRHHAHGEGGQHRPQIGDRTLIGEKQRQVAQDLAVAITQRQAVVTLPRFETGTGGQIVRQRNDAGLPRQIDLLAGHAVEFVLLEVDAMAGQHLEPSAAGALRQPDRVRHQDVGELVDQGIEEIEPGPGRERLRQLGQQGVLQQRQLLGEIGRQLGAAGGVERRNPAATHLLGWHVLAAPEHMAHLAPLLAEVTDELGRLL